MSHLSPLASWTLVLIVVGLPTLALGCVLRVASWASRAEERAPLHRHVCSRCKRVQLWTEPFEQWSPCPACQRLQPGMVATEKKPDEAKPKRPYDDQKQGSFIPGRRMVELDLDNMTPDQIREALIEGEQTCRISARS